MHDPSSSLYSLWCTLCNADDAGLSTGIGTPSAVAVLHYAIHEPMRHLLICLLDFEVKSRDVFLEWPKVFARHPGFRRQPMPHAVVSVVIILRTCDVHRSPDILREPLYLHGSSGEHSGILCFSRSGL